MAGRNRLTFLRLLVGTVAALLLIIPAHADMLVGSPGDSGSCIPFGCSDASVFQQVFDASLFSSPVTITGLQFLVFDDPFGPPNVDTVFPAQFHIQFSIVPVAVNALDSTLANNLSGAVVVQDFFIGQVADPVGGLFTIDTTPANFFTYDPALGNLLMQIETDADFNDPTITMFASTNTASGGKFSSAWDSTPNTIQCPDGSSASSCLAPDSGLVVDFRTATDISTVPEPSAILLLFTVLAMVAVPGWRRRVKSSL
jgi:hypothetical protein